jgi:hypothetical protein
MCGSFVGSRVAPVAVVSGLVSEGIPTCGCIEKDLGKNIERWLHIGALVPHGEFASSPKQVEKWSW